MRLQVLVCPATQTLAEYSFLEITQPNRTLEELAVSIKERHARLYPHQPELIIHKLQDADSNDLDLEYIVGDVFSDKSTDKDSSIVRVIRLSPNRRSSIQPELTLLSQRKHGRHQSLIGLPGRRPHHLPNSFTPRGESGEDGFDGMGSSGSLHERECKRHKVTPGTQDSPRFQPRRSESMDEIIPESSLIGAEDSLRWSMNSDLPPNRSLFGKPRSPSIEGNASPHNNPHPETPGFPITRTGKNRVDVPCSQVSDASTPKPKGAPRPSNLLPNSGFQTLIPGPSVDVQEDEFTTTTRCTFSPSPLSAPTSTVPLTLPNGTMEYSVSFVPSVPTELTPKVSRLQRTATTQPKELLNLQGLRKSLSSDPSNISSRHERNEDNKGKESPQLHRAHIETPSAQILSGLVSQEIQNNSCPKTSSLNKSTVEREDRAMVDEASAQKGLQIVNTPVNSLASQKGADKRSQGVSDNQTSQQVEENLKKGESKVAVAEGEKAGKLADTRKVEKARKAAERKTEEVQKIEATRMVEKARKLEDTRGEDGARKVEEVQNLEEAQRVGGKRKVEVSGNDEVRNVKKDQEQKTKVQKANNEKLQVKEQRTREKKTEEIKNTVEAEKKGAEAERKKAGVAAEKQGEELKKIGKELKAKGKAEETEGKRHEKLAKQKKNQLEAGSKRAKTTVMREAESDSIQKSDVAPPTEELPASQVGRKRQISESPLTLEKGGGKKQKVTKTSEKDEHIPKTASAPSKKSTLVAKPRRSVSFADVDQPVLPAQGPDVSENSTAQKTSIPMPVPLPKLSQAAKPAAKKAKMEAKEIMALSGRRRSKLSKEIVESSGSDSEVAQQTSERINSTPMKVSRRPVDPMKPSSDPKQEANKGLNSGPRAESESESESEPESEFESESESESELGSEYKSVLKENRTIEMNDAATEKESTLKTNEHVTGVTKGSVSCDVLPKRQFARRTASRISTPFSVVKETGTRHGTKNGLHDKETKEAITSRLQKTLEDTTSASSESDTDTASSTSSESEADTAPPRQPGVAPRDDKIAAQITEALVPTKKIAEQIVEALFPTNKTPSQTPTSKPYLPLSSQKYRPLSQLTPGQEQVEVPKLGSQVSKKEDSDEEDDEEDSDSESDSDSDSSGEDTIPGSQRPSGTMVATEKKPGVSMTRSK